MGFYKQNATENDMFEFPRIGFWTVHTVGGMMLFMLGMRFAIRKAPLPILAFRFMEKLIRK